MSVTVLFTDRHHPHAQTPERLPGSHVKQVHGVTVVRASARPFDSRLEGDGQWTDQTSLRLIIKTADCVPLLFEARDWVAALHCGWRSGLGGIIPELHRILHEAGHTEAPMRVWVGPHIQQCCFQVGPEVVCAGKDLLSRWKITSTAQWFAADSVAGKFKVNLLSHYQAQINSLWKQAIPLNADHVQCTRCHTDKYFSYRAEGYKGNLYSIIERKQD